MSASRLLAWLLLDRGAGSRAAAVGAAILLMQGAVLCTAAGLDHALWLSGKGIGLLEHPGIPTILFADAASLALLGLAARRFLRLPGRLPVTSEPANRRYLRQVIAHGRSIILLRGRAGALYVFGVGIGTLFWVQNAIQTRDALAFYGHDVFDSSEHRFSYVTFRLVLWGSWGVLYPYVTVAFFGISGTLYRATATLARRGRLEYRLFHPDRSGGFATIGDISFAAIMTVLVLYVSLAVVMVTHHKLNILQVSGIVILSAALILLTYFISWPVTQFMWGQRRRERRRGYRRLMHGPDPFTALQLIWSDAETTYSPYARYQVWLINCARIAPLAIAVARLMEMI